MEFYPIERAPAAFQQPVSQAEILQMCRRAFGEDCRVELARELSGGLYNSTFLVQFADSSRVVLRIGPPEFRQYQSELNLMRSEYASLPYFAPIAPLLPKLIMADFTHQLIDRDYLFQSFIEGENWAQINKQLTSDEKKSLWREVGTLTKKIHAVKGPHFNYSFTGPTFPTWGAAVIARLTAQLGDLDRVQLQAEDLRKLLALAERYASVLDQITAPSLLHGDLWLVNILVSRVGSQPRIVGLIDNDRASWGDPMADWTIFLLERNTAPEIQAFWETYGKPEPTNESRLRQLIYYGCHNVAVLLEQFRIDKASDMARTYRELKSVIEQLESFSLK